MQDLYFYVYVIETQDESILYNININIRQTENCY